MTTITFWSNGFQVNDGPFRDNEAEENKAFLADIAKGCVRGVAIAQLRRLPS